MILDVSVRGLHYVFERFVTCVMSADTRLALLRLATACPEMMHWTSQNAFCIRKSLMFSDMLDLNASLMSYSLHAEHFISLINKNILVGVPRVKPTN